MKTTNKFSFEKSYLRDEVLKRMEDNCINYLRSVRESDEKPAFLSKYRIAYAGMALLIICGAALFAAGSFNKGTPRDVQTSFAYEYSFLSIYSR